MGENGIYCFTYSVPKRVRIAEHVIQTEDKDSVKVTASLGIYTLTADELTVIKDRHFLKERALLSSQAKPTRTRAAVFSQNKPSGSANALSDIQQQLPKDICQHLISSADKALYEAKDRGRNEVVSANDLLAVEA